MCSPIPCAICTTPSSGPPPVQRELAMDSPSLLVKRKLASAMANADENAGAASRGLAASMPRNRRRPRGLLMRSGLRPDDPRALAVAFDDHPVSGAQARV